MAVVGPVTGDEGADLSEATLPQHIALPATLGALVLMVASALLPNVAVIGDAPGGRWLVPTAKYFLVLDGSKLPHTDLDQLGLGMNTLYLGLGLQQLGFVLGAVTIWVLATQDMNRWLYRGAVISGWMLAVGGMFAVTGFGLMSRAGAPVELGWAWLPTLLSGLIVIVIGRLSTDRIDRSWYVARPELQ